MIQYSEQSSSAQSPSAPAYENEAVLEHSLARDKVSLSQIWQYLTRTKCLPDGLDLDVFFAAIHEKLKDPEWEVRQHTLRVLRDFIRNADSSFVNNKTESIFEDLLLNLGHVSPAVRKAAVDCLRTYLNQSNNADNILSNLFEKVIERSNEKNVQTNIILGVILATPFLILPNLSDDTLFYIIQQVLRKSTEEKFKEAAVRSLLRVKYIISANKFNEILDMNSAIIPRENFEKLSASYDLNFKCQQENKGNKSVWSDFNDNLLDEIEDPFRVDDNLIDESAASSEIIEDRVILETEIQLNSGPAVTMQLHEQSRQNSFNETTDSEEEIRHSVGIVKVLTDDSEQDDELQRRTPRRVRFGGEVVKMRTPDSDSNGTGDEKEVKKPKRHTKSAQNRRSFIPVRISGNRMCQSEPTSPQRIKRVKNNRSYVSTPDLSKTKHIFGPKISYVSKIPRKKKAVFHSTINITIDSNPKPTLIKKQDGKASEVKPTTKPEKQETKPNLLNPPHQGIEILYNLTQSPQRNQQKNEPASNANTDTNPENASKFENEEQLPKSSAKEAKSEPLPNQNSDQKEEKKNFSSFRVCDVNFGSDCKDRNASFVTVSDSFSFSSDERNGSNQSEKITEIHDIMKELQRQEDVTTRLRGLKSLFKVLKTSSDLEFLQDYFAQILNLLFSASDQPALRLLSQEILSFVFENTETRILQGKLNQIAMFLSKMGMPDGVRLAMKIIRKVSVSEFIDQLLSRPILHAKSSKIREGSIQIMISICRLCPSTDVEVSKVAKSVINVLGDRKRKVRQAALELLAILAQLGSISVLLEIAAAGTQDHPEGERILRALRNRLSRKQLPAVETNGLIRYSTPIGESELEWLSLGSGSPPDQKTFSSRERISSTTGITSDKFTSGYWQRDDRYRVVGSRRPMEIHSASNVGWSRSSASNYKDPENGNLSRTGIWAIESSPVVTSNQSLVNGTLRPIYVLQPNILTPTNTLDLNKQRVPEAESHEVSRNATHSDSSSRNKSSSPKKANAVDNSDKPFYNSSKFRVGSRTDFFRKSFSSDSICSKDKSTQSVSSGCSSTSGSSTRSGTWHRELRSGIPVPVTKAKFKGKYLQPSTMYPAYESSFR